MMTKQIARFLFGLGLGVAGILFATSNPDHKIACHGPERAQHHQQQPLRRHLTALPGADSVIILAV